MLCFCSVAYLFLAFDFVFFSFLLGVPSLTLTACLAFADFPPFLAGVLPFPFLADLADLADFFLPGESIELTEGRENEDAWVIANSVWGERMRGALV